MPCRHFVVTSVPCVVLQQHMHHSHRFKRTISNYKKKRRKKREKTNHYCLLQHQDTEDIFEARNIDEICSQNRKADWDNFCTFRNNIISKVWKRKFDYFDELTEKLFKHERFGNKHWKKLVTSILRRRREKRVLTLTKFPYCVKTEQLLTQIKNGKHT